MPSTLRASIADGLRLGVRSVRSGVANPDFVKGLAFAVLAESIQMPHGDPLRLRYENAVAVLTSCGPTAAEQLVALESVLRSLLDS
jgi:hypothetical protein